MGTYWEHFNFQASQWNGAPGVHWSFYLNVGVEFKDLERRKNYVFLAQTHCAGRIEQIVLSAPHAWRYNAETNREALIRELLPLIESASQIMACNITHLRSQYVTGEFIYFDFTKT